MPANQYLTQYTTLASEQAYQQLRAQGVLFVKPCPADSTERSQFVLDSTQPHTQESRSMIDSILSTHGLYADWHHYVYTPVYRL